LISLVFGEEREKGKRRGGGVPDEDEIKRAI
jgi:hypothetical protein